MTISILNAAGILAIRDFGAVGDTHEGMLPGTPCVAALQTAVRALDPLRGGEIYLPYAPGGGYYFEAPVLIDRPVYIHGAGRSYADPATRIYAAPGVTPLIFMGLATRPDNDGATGFIIEKLNVSALGKTQSGKMPALSSIPPTRGQSSLVHTTRAGLPRTLAWGRTGTGA